MYKRIILKLSGEALAGESNNSFGFCDFTIEKIVGDIVSIANLGVEVALVVGGGNYWRGRSGAEWLDRAKSDQIGMVATVMNALYLAENFRKQGKHAVIMTPIIIGTVTEQFSKDRALEHLKQGTILIFAGGTGHPFFSTDTITAIRGLELSADALLFAKNVDGVYDKDPNKNSGAQKYTHVTYSHILANDLRVIDLAAMGLCMEVGITSVVFGLNEPGGLSKAVSGDDEKIYSIGTKVTN
ncbi:MAG: UMP kinase [Defluviitaleaceae bacterium]|nr:UMP kinase [Defluviitaleaceae bacterium]